MHEFGFGVFPVAFPGVGQQFFGVGDVSDGGVEPHIEHFAFGSFDGYGHAPVEVTAHGAGLQAHVEPRLALSVDVGFPLFVAFENPFPQEALVTVEGEVPVFGLAQHGTASADGRLGVDEVGGVERCAAGFALVAVGVFVLAVGAGTGDVAVGEELSGLFVVILFALFLDEDAFVVEGTEEVRRHFLVNVRCRA